MTKTKVIISILALAIAFAVGRYSEEAAVVVATKQESNDDVEVHKDQDTHIQTTKTETKKPDGTDTIVTVTDQVKNITTDKNEVKTTKTEQTVSIPNTLNISGMAGYDTYRHMPVYGVSVTKQLVGPVTIGAFGLTGTTVGLTIGLNF